MYDQTKPLEEKLGLTSDVKFRDSVLPQDSLETVFQCLGLGLAGWCLGLGLGVVSLVKKQDSLTTSCSAPPPIKR